jgi:anti-anti-sigma factor
MGAIAIERHDGVPVTRPLHDIDAATAGQVHTEIAACIDGRTDTLIVDLSDTEYVDSAGVDMLFRLATLLDDRRMRLRLVIPADVPLARLAAIVALPSAAPVHETVSAALEATAQERSAPAAQLADESQ